MSKVRVLVGTRKGAFILTADGKRERWDVSGPHFGGWEMYHLKGSPVDPNRIYASQSSSWFGQVIQRSSDGGKTWEAVGNKFAYEGAVGNHLWYDGTQRLFEFARVWHLEPSLTDPDTVYAGIQDAALFRTTGSCRSTGRSCAATTPANRGRTSAETCRPISASRSTCTRTSRIPSTSSRSRATPSTISPTASCACTGAAAAGTSGSR